METNFNFKSQICTSKVQSERLLALGLKKETADIVHYFSQSLAQDWTIVPLADGEIARYIQGLEIPAWSLHRLLCLYGADYTIKEVYNNAEECYGMLICAIEIAIEDGDFNEEYLEKQWE